MSSIKLRTRVDFRLVSSASNGGLSHAFLRSSFYDSSKSRNLSSRFISKKPILYSLRSTIKISSLRQDIRLKSSIKGHNYTVMILKSMIDKQITKSFRISSSYSESSLVSMKMKSQFLKRSWEVNVFKTSFLKLRRDDTIQMSLSSTFKYVGLPKDGVYKDLSSIRFYGGRIIYISGGFKGVHSNKIAFKYNPGEFRSRVESNTLVFRKIGTKQLGHTRRYLSSIKTTLKQNRGSTRSVYISFIGVFGTLGGTRSKAPISFSTNRDIVDFEISKETAVKMPILIESIDFRKKATEIYVSLGANLFRTVASRLEKGVYPFIEKKEDYSVFNMVDSIQSFDLDIAVTKFHISLYKYDTRVHWLNQDSVPFFIERYNRTNISVSRSLQYDIHLKNAPRVYADILFDSSINKAGSVIKRNMEVSCNLDDVTKGKGGIHENGGLLPVMVGGAFSLLKTSSLIVTGSYQKRDVQGEKVDVVVYVENSEGVTVGTNIITKTVFNGGRVSAEVSFSTSSPYDYGRVSCKIQFNYKKTLFLLNLNPFRQHFTIGLRERRNYGGIIGRSIWFKTTLYSNKGGTKSAPQYLSANMFFVLGRIGAKINFKVDT